MYKLRLGISLQMFKRGEAKIDENFEEDLDEIKRLGFDSIDVNYCSIYHREGILQSHALIKQGLDLVKQRGIYINAIHLPFGAQRDYSKIDDEFRKQLVEDTAEMLRLSDAFQPYCYVMHGGIEPVYEDERAARISALHDSLRLLSPATKNLICVENLPRLCLLNTIDEHRQAMDGVQECKNIKLCCDVNHYLKERAEDAVITLGDRIKTLHISDHDYIDERHVLPGDGKINWMALIGALEKTGYQGVFNYEITRELNGYVFYKLCDVKNNYEKLFEQYNALTNI